MSTLFKMAIQSHPKPNGRNQFIRTLQLFAFPYRSNRTATKK